MKKKMVLLPITLLAGFAFGYSASNSLGGGLTGNPLLASRGSSGKYYSDYTSQEDALQAGRDTNYEIAAEGITLLKNKDNILPLENVKRVSVFGKNSVDPFYHGFGAGSQQSTMDPIDLYEGLEAAGFETNKVLKEFYENDDRSGSGRKVDMGIGETPLSLYDDSVKASIGGYHDAAIIVLSRATTEGSYDPYRNFVYDQDPTVTYEDRHYLEVSKNEEDMINYVKSQGFDKIIVVINSASAFEVGDFKDDDAIGGLLWIASPGNDGFKALGQILNGEVNPSGRLVDTFYRDFTADPTFQNFGDNSQTSDDHKTTHYQYLDSETGEPLEGIQYKEFVQYEEGIYVGYKYYETMYADMVASDGQTAADEWYERTMAYPFGYGLSYTSFEVTGVTTSLTQNSDLSTIKDGKIDISVTVKNTGDVAGKKVVQLYYHTPYIDGGIEKSDVVLGAFAKTPLLQPSKSATVTMEVYVQDMASYDFEDKNNNGHYGYELDPGDYELRINADAHSGIEAASGVDTVLNYTIAGNDAITYDTDRITGEKVENRFDSTQKEDGSIDENDYNSLPDPIGSVKMTRMTRASSNHLVMPSAPTDSESTISKDGSLYKKLTTHFDLGSMTSDNKYYRQKTGTETQIAEDVDDSTRTHTVKFSDLYGVDLEDEKYETMLNELKYSEMVYLVSHGMRSIPALDAIGMPSAWNFDGPTCINQVDYGSSPLMAATWNVDLINKMGRAMGDEALWIGLHELYGPGMDTHRSPFGGRNYEYFSEDGYLAGAMAAAEIQGAQSKGLGMYAKHFALNEQETSRTGVATYVDEQTMRELYFKPFQMAVEQGGALGVMTAFNKVGDSHTYGNYALVTELLKGEWAFDGTVVTDTGVCGTLPTATTSSNYSVSSQMVNYWQQNLSGNDLNLGNITDTSFFGTYDATRNGVYYQPSEGSEVDATSLWLAVRESTKRIVYMNAHSSLGQNGVDISSFTGSETFSIGSGITMNRDLSIDASNFGTTNIAYRVTSGSLPDGFELETTGLLTGVTTAQGEYDFTITLFADGWISSSKDFHVTVTEAVHVEDSDGNAVREIKANEAFNGAVVTDFLHYGDTRVGMDNMSEWRTFSVNSWTFSLLSGSLPDGLSLASDGTLSGTPTKAGTYNFVINITVIEDYMAGSAGNRPATWTIMYTSNVTLVVTEDETTEDVTPTDPEDTNTSTDTDTTSSSTSDTTTNDTTNNTTTPTTSSGNGVAITALVASIVAIIAAGISLFFYFRKK